MCSVDPNRLQVGRQLDIDTISVRAELLERPREQRVDRPQFRLPERGASFEAGEVKQVVDESLASPQLDPDCLEKLVTFSCTQLECRIVESFARGPNRRQRRPQVVTHRAQDGGLHRVALPKCLGFDGFARKPA